METWAFLLIRKAVTTARAKEMTLSGIGPAAWRNHGADLYCTEMPVDDLSMSPCPSPCDIVMDREMNRDLLMVLANLNRRYTARVVNAFVARLLGHSWHELESRYGKSIRSELRGVVAKAREIAIRKGLAAA